MADGSLTCTPCGTALGLIASLGLCNSASLQGVIVVGRGNELSPVEVGREFGVSPATVRRWGQKGWLLPTRRLIGSGYRRYARSAVEEFRRRAEAGEFEGVEIAAKADGADPA